MRNVPSASRLVFLVVAVLGGIAAWSLEARPDRASGAPLTPRTSIPIRGTPAFSAPVHADSVGVLLERHHDRRVPGIDVEDYFLYLPPGMERGEEEWPLVLWLHGRSLRGRDLSLLKRYGPPALIARGRQLPFVVVAPQLPPDGSWYDLAPVADLLDDVLARYPIDPERVYLLGFSMGGGGAYRMAFDYGDRFAAMIAIAGHTPEATPEHVLAVRRFPFLAIHGDRDFRVPLAPARRMAEALERDGAPEFEFRLVPGMDHSRLERLTRDDGLYAWLLGHRRKGTLAGG